MPSHDYDLQPHLHGWEVFQKLWTRTSVSVVAVLAGLWLFLV